MSHKVMGCCVHFGAPTARTHSSPNVLYDVLALDCQDRYRQAVKDGAALLIIEGWANDRRPYPPDRAAEQKAQYVAAMKSLTDFAKRQGADLDINVQE